MANKPLLLEQVYEPESSTPNDGALRQLRKENQRLEDELREVRQQRDDFEIAKQRLELSVRNLRQQLSPLHRALRALFGEIELAVGEERVGPSVPGAPQTAASSSDPRWESYKQSFPGVPSRIIDALLAHPQLSYTQLATMVRAHYDTIKSAAAKLKNAGAIAKEGTMCRLNR